MKDKEFNDLMGNLAMYVRRKVVAALLRGNDTQCFTTEQYEMAYVKMNWRGQEDHGMRMFHNYDPELARKHLQSLGLKEVKPNVWSE